MGKMYEFAIALGGKVAASLPQSTSAVSRSLQNIQDNAQGATQSLNNIDAGGLAGKFKGIGLAVGGIATALGGIALAGAGAAVSFGDDLQKSLNGIQAGAGVADDQMAGMKETLLSIYNDNFGEGFEDISAAMTTASQQTGLTGDALKLVTENGLALKDTFGMEVAESVRGANQLMKQFGLSGTESYNLITQGAQSGLDANGDLLDTLKEYGGTFAAQGFNAEEMFNMLSNASKSGIRDTDLAADAIKEFGIRSVDGSKGSAAGFEALGLNASKMTKSFATGGDVAKEAFRKTTAALLAMKDPVEQNAAGVALFGTQFEDMGIKGITALVNTQGEVSKTKDALGKINDVKYNTFGEAMAGIGRNLQTGILLPLSEKIMPRLNQFAGWITDNMPAIQNEISYAMDVASGVFSSISEVINTNVMPIFSALSGYITENMPQIKGAIQAMYDYVEPSFSRLGEVIKSDLMPMVQSLWGLVEAAMPTIKVIFEVALAVIATVLKQAVENVATFIEVVAGIYDFIKPGLDLVIGAFNGIAGAIQWAIDKLGVFNKTPAKEKNLGDSKWSDTNSAYAKQYGYANDHSERVRNNAMGTDNWSGGWTWVGEKGPELLNIQRGAQIIPNHRLLTHQDSPLMSMAGQITPHAAGGIMTSPHVGLVAEAGPEAIIPLNGSTQAISLWQKAGEILGLTNHINLTPGSGSLTMDGPSPQSKSIFAEFVRDARGEGGSTSYIDSTQPITFESHVIVNAGNKADKKELEAIIRRTNEDQQSNFVRWLESYNRGKRRVSYQG